MVLDHGSSVVDYFSVFWGSVVWARSFGPPLSRVRIYLNSQSYNMHRHSCACVGAHVRVYVAIAFVVTHMTMYI